MAALTILCHRYHGLPNALQIDFDNRYPEINSIFIKEAARIEYTFHHFECSQTAFSMRENVNINAIQAVIEQLSEYALAQTKIRENLPDASKSFTRLGIVAHFFLNTCEEFNIQVKTDISPTNQFRKCLKP